MLSRKRANVPLERRRRRAYHSSRETGTTEPVSLAKRLFMYRYVTSSATFAVSTTTYNVQFPYCTTELVSPPLKTTYVRTIASLRRETSLDERNDTVAHGRRVPFSQSVSKHCCPPDTCSIIWSRRRTRNQNVTYRN